MIKRAKYVVKTRPIGAPRMTKRDKWAKRPCVVDYFAYRDVLRLSVGKLPEADSVTEFSFQAFFRAKNKEDIGSFHRAKPDLDNIQKGILDALFAKDQGIARCVQEKRWGLEDCIIIEIAWEVPDEVEAQS